ncbi:sensor histidine kinase [Taibaiella chishuiensis]|uniref:histidine kinase n=1 Tax=Taibaiella chishuiensis TaxID=1434707 RepID=A0A2P8CWZ6_9BACT|nr:sensor histidine kinase [Taibaiella chishuiensis]PSK89502.1 two-component sensor histidine kinase [Taibaiella chishuiensis]
MGVHALFAQRLSIQQQVARIDSLILYRNFEAGEKQLDHLYDSIIQSGSRHELRESELRLLLNKAYLYKENKKESNALKAALDVIEAAEKLHFFEIEYEACLMAALVYELSNEFDLCKTYLGRAHRLYKQQHLESLYSHYCIRVSSYYRFVKQKDTALYFATQGFNYARVYKNKRDYLDGCLLLGILLPKHDLEGAVKYASLAAYGFLELNDYYRASSMYNNIAHKYLLRGDNDKARQYNDSALWIFNNNALPANFQSFKIRYLLFDTLGKVDSAYYYFRKYHDAYVAANDSIKAANIKKVTEQYENDKKQAIIKSKDRQLAFIILLLLVIATASFLLIRKNRKINIQNKVIRKQVEELMKMLEQKQVLLSELQHRVKNNLQHVISILELQKESVNFNNIDELIRGNQNRIHSMALLHKKLNVSEHVNEVDLEKYILDLSELVKDSYDTPRKKISMDVTCTIAQMSIEKALPVGLIIVELVSNSMKHAFVKRHTGTIHITLGQDIATGKNILYYADNGRGFDFNKHSEKGLGMEIIKGLIGQLDATAKSSPGNGFELTLHFK